MCHIATEMSEMVPYFSHKSCPGPQGADGFSPCCRPQPQLSALSGSKSTPRAHRYCLCLWLDAARSLLSHASTIE